MRGRVGFFALLMCALAVVAGPGAMPAQAEAAVAEASARRGVDAETLWQLGREAAEAGSLDQAVGYYRQSLAIDPHGKAAMVDLATTLSDMERWEDARATYEKAVKLYPDDASALNGLGYVHFRQDRFQQAVECYTKALAHQDDPQFHLNLGLALLSQGRWGQAERQFRDTLALDADHYWATNNLGYALSLQGRRAEAADAYWAALRLKSPGITTHLNLGALLAEAEAWDDAAWVYTDALKRDDTDAEAHVGLAQALARLGRLDEARREAIVGVRLAPTSARAHFTLSESAFLAGDRTGGISAGQRAVTLAPTNGEYHLVLAKMLAFKERYAEAIAAYEAFLRLAPTHAEAAHARMMVRLLNER
jgi:tetratricopeptide (TPR) repeat protein